ncbi:PcfJ domain-containing protein [Anaerovibrio sp.]|uniref:PcfJ domain-containing protein n=1 Tax=Anaerovibrio sp. TaxID=1872532 RepID=UPI00388D5622
MDGLLGQAVLNLSYTSEKHEMAFVPYRWRVFQRSSSKSTYIACDVMKVQYCRNGIIRRWLSYSLSVDIVKNKVIISKIEQKDNTRIDWTETDIDVPDVVVETAIEALRESTLCSTGIKPSVLCQIKNKTTLLGYIERPFDVNIVFLKKFLREFVTRDGEDIFDEIFTREEKNNYKIICDLLEIKPPKSLRKAYAFNPYAIVWYMIFQQWGIKDINYLHKFFYLDIGIANMYLHRFYYDRKEKRVTRDVALMHWLALEFYCKWLLEQKGEKRMLKWLYVTSKEESMTQLKWDILFSFSDHHKKLSEEVIQRLLKDGLTDYVHDAISTEVTALAENWEETKIKYNKIEQTYACKINGYEFKLLLNTKMLSKLGAAFNNCVATYRDRILRHESVIIYVMNKEEYLACIELQKGCHIVQASGKYNSRLNREVNNVCYYWAKYHHLEIDVDDILPMSPEELSDFDDVTVEPIPYIKAVDEMNLEELINLETGKIYKGYYLRLEQLLSNSKKYPLSAPYWMEFTDEISRLTYLLPEGERIFSAASNGNNEAMIALGRMYFRGRVIQQDYEKSLEWLNKAGKAGALKAFKMAGTVMECMNRELSDRDRAILLGLSELRHRVAVGGLG